MPRFVYFDVHQNEGRTEMRAYNPEYVVWIRPNGKDWTSLVIANGDTYNERNNIIITVRGAFKDVIQLLEGNAQ